MLDILTKKQEKNYFRTGEIIPVIRFGKKDANDLQIVLPELYLKAVSDW